MWNPRMGGEKFYRKDVRNAHLGSPPHGRGKVSFSPLRRRRSRITPAWAGKSATSERKNAPNKDHPRMGGEKSRPVRASRPFSGSPPHGRGKDSVMDGLQRVHGITPAWAGKRFQCPASRAGQGDHPRMGGEKIVFSIPMGTTMGSPPHGRGKGVVFNSRKYGIGITPAWAGKRQCISSRHLSSMDHPRMGGEKLKVPFLFWMVMGSPPHGRGKASAYPIATSETGITPAWAGKSPASQPWSPPLWMMVIRPRP